MCTSMSLIRALGNGSTLVILFQVFGVVASAFCSHRFISPSTFTYSHKSPVVVAVRRLSTSFHCICAHTHPLPRTSSPPSGIRVPLVASPAVPPHSWTILWLVWMRARRRRRYCCYMHIPRFVQILLLTQAHWYFLLCLVVLVSRRVSVIPFIRVYRVYLF